MKPLLLASIVLAASTAHAQLLGAADISSAAARKLGDAALAACQAQGRQIVVTVLDRGGNIVSVQRADSVGPHNTEASRRKAYTALSTKSDTWALANAARNNPDMQNLASMPELLLLGGGLQLKAHGQVVGAIGVAGGGGALPDRACAMAAIAALPDLDTVNP
ncbi:GlcG/HbpS family heme-binding protein [Janthinobacterium aquaticum]|uniref:GlcG/HbpS family heme-binding protein n=1 Tax=Janthinobacterium sp. FT58W TaxID=2654254 RepID=UPI001264E15B|nr:heme-binding protein [Janthinobacterium sp. FT58W]KAB8041260.1 heme-binding protein [Janthinobacterium sp. FT58W]